MQYGTPVRTDSGLFLVEMESLVLVGWWVRHQNQQCPRFANRGKQ